MKSPSGVLVIKFDGLADFVDAFAAIRRIRDAYPRDRLTLMTAPAFAALARACPFVDQVEVIAEIEPMTLAGQIRRARYGRVFDLDGAARSDKIRRWAWPFRPAWTITSRDRSVPLLDRHAAQLRAAGAWPDAPVEIGDAPGPDLSWVARLSPPARPVPGAIKTRPYVVLVPGGPSAARWPACHFGAVAQALRAQGYDIVVVGPPDESALARQIQKSDPKSRDLTGRSDYAVIAALAQRASLAIGNQTGLLNLCAATGAPTVALSPTSSDPMLTGPRGHVAFLQAPNLADMTPAQVVRAAGSLLPQQACAS